MRLKNVELLQDRGRLLRPSKPLCVSPVPGPDHARSQAVIATGEMVRDTDGRFWDGPEWRMHVTDEDGATVCEIRISGRGADA